MDEDAVSVFGKKKKKKNSISIACNMIKLISQSVSQSINLSINQALNQQNMNLNMKALTSLTLNSPPIHSTLNMQLLLDKPVQKYYYF